MFSDGLCVAAGRLKRLAEIPAQAHRARFRAAGDAAETGEKFAADAVPVAAQIGGGGFAPVPFGFVHQRGQFAGVGVETDDVAGADFAYALTQIGRASCRERV